MTIERDGPDELVAGFRTVTSTLAAARRAVSPATLAEHQVPVTLLTGFLGSGKTTVLRHLLTADHGLRLTAIVNDLGAVNVDAQMLGLATPSTGPGDRLELTNGCACCALNDELADTLTAVLASEHRPDAVVIEASGGADAVAMAATVEAEPGTRLDGIVGLVDAATWSAKVDHPTLGPLVRRQLETAHLVLLSKVDLVEVAAVDAIVEAIGDLAPGRQVVPIVGGVVEPAVALGAALQGAALRPPARPHDASLATTTVQLDRALDVARLSTWLESDHGLLRAKGWLVGTDGGRYELQLVGRRWTLEPSAASPATASVVLIAVDTDTVGAAARGLLDAG